MHYHKINYYLKILSISTLLCLFLVIKIEHTLFQGDAPQYYILGSNLNEGNGFSLSENSPYLPSMHREPVYPFFISVIFFIFGNEFFAVQLTQVVIFILICILVGLLANEVFNAEISRYSLFITAFCPTLISYPAFLYSEILAVFLILLSIFSLTKAIKKQSLLWYCISGFTLGISALCKAIMFPFFGVVLLSLFYLLKNEVSRKKLQLLLSFSLCFAIIVSPWIVRNYLVFNKAEISLRGGKVLLTRAQKLDYGTEEIVKHIVFSFSETLGDMIYKNPNRKRISDVYLGDSLKLDEYWLELEKKGIDAVEIDNIFYHEALQKIKNHPFKYIILTPLESIKMMSFIYLPSLNQPYILDNKNSNIFLKLLIFSFKGLMRLLSYITIIMFLLGIYYKRNDWKSWIFLLLIVLYINLVHSLTFGDGRYATPIIPYYLIFTAVTVDYFKKCILSKNLLSH